MTTEFNSSDIEIIRTESGIKLYDTIEGDLYRILPGSWSDEKVDGWLAGHVQGMKEGHKEGLADGVYSVQTAILKALGLDATIAEFAQNIKALAQVLYWHDGICKEDVAHIAGRE